MLINARDRSLEDNVGTLPTVAGAVAGRLKPMVFGLIKKVVDQVTFDTTETATSVRTGAELQPYKPTELEIQAVGSRSWRWSILRALPDLVMDTDDVVTIGVRTFRVMSVYPWQDFGFVEYKLVEDYHK